MKAIAQPWLPFGERESLAGLLFSMADGGEHKNEPSTFTHPSTTLKSRSWN